MTCPKKRSAAIEFTAFLDLDYSSYEECTYHELSLHGIPVRFPCVTREGISHRGYRLDPVVGQLVVGEFKAVEKIEPIHQAQLLAT